VDFYLLCRLYACNFLQVTSEMRDNEPIVRHLVPFEATFTHGTVVAVQFGAECQNGYYQPVPRLLNLTSDLDLCIEHRTDPVKCFAELATEKVLDTYESIEHYQVFIACDYLPYSDVLVSSSFHFFVVHWYTRLYSRLVIVIH